MASRTIFNYRKNIIKQGYGKCQPTEFSECHILLHLHDQEQQCPSNANGIGYQLDEEITIVLGQGMTQVACIVDLCVQTMFKGEQCILNATESTVAEVDFLKLEVTLLSFVAANELHGISYEDKLMRATALKKIGTAAFVAGNISAAFHKFSRSLKYLTCAAADHDVSRSECTDNQSQSSETCVIDSNHLAQSSVSEASNQTLCNFAHEDIARLTGHCWLNLAACQLHYRNFKMAAINCSRALDLDPNNVKGLFRRAQCSMQIGDEHSAVVDLEHALTVEPGNREITRLLSTARQLIRQSDDRLAASMSKMFR